jgi:hypothetical protein
MYLFVIVAGNEDIPIFEQELRYRWLLVYAYPTLTWKMKDVISAISSCILGVGPWRMCPQPPVAVVYTYFGERTLLIVMYPLAYAPGYNQSRTVTGRCVQ